MDSSYKLVQQYPKLDKIRLVKQPDRIILLYWRHSELHTWKQAYKFSM